MNSKNNTDAMVTSYTLLLLLLMIISSLFEIIKNVFMYIIDCHTFIYWFVTFVLSLSLLIRTFKRSDVTLLLA